MYFIPQGTPALFLILLLYNSSMLPAYTEDERWVLVFNIYLFTL